MIVTPKQRSVDCGLDLSIVSSLPSVLQMTIYLTEPISHSFSLGLRLGEVNEDLSRFSRPSSHQFGVNERTVWYDGGRGRRGGV